MSGTNINPLQALVDVIAENTCTMKKLLQNLGADSGGETTVPVVVRPLKGASANIKTIIVRTTPTLIVCGNSKRANISIVNGGAASVFIGPDELVTTDAGPNPGYPILAGGEISNDTYIGSIWAVVAAGTIRLGVWEEETA